MNNRFLSLLGIARKAGKLSLGHDGVKASLNSGRARLIIFSSESSQRLKEELTEKAKSNNTDIIETEYKMIELSFSIGGKAGVISVDDDGFAKRLKELYNK